LAETSANMAIELAGKLIRQQLSPTDHERLIREAIDRFPLATDGGKGVARIAAPSEN
jgi:hypothetical protein